MAASSSALISSTPRAFASPKSLFSSKPQSQSQTLTFPKSFLGLLRFPSAPRSISLSRPAKSFAVQASAELPLVGNVAPDFEAEAVFDQEFIKVKLSDYIGKKYVILFFYPLDFTFVCPTEITAFSDRHAEFEQLNTEVLGVSVDSVFSHLAWVQTDRKSGGLGDLNYPLVSDVTKSISKSYGVLIPDQGIASRVLFIIDKEGVIQHSTVNNLAIGRSVDETKRTLQALQFVQDNPDEVCPAGWKPQYQSQTLTFPKSFLGLRLPSALHSISLSRPAKSFAVKASAELPLVGNVAPDFEANAVFHKEFIKEFINLIHTPNPNPKSQFSSSHHDSSFFKAKTPHFPILSTKTKSTPTPQTLIKSLKPQSPPPHPYSDFHEKALYLDSIGLDLFSLVAHHPPIVSFPISDLKSTVHFLLASAGFSTLELHRLVGMCPEILTSKVSNILPVFTFLLREARVNGSDLKRVINRRPRLLASSVKHRLRPTLYFLQSIGITHVNKHTSLLSCSVENKLQPRVDYLEKIGFSRADALAMFRRFPQLFCYSIEHNLEPKFNYFVVQMGRELKELKEFPHYFSFSLDNRIRSRHQRCVDRGVFFPLPILLKTSETKFRERLECCCNSSIPLTRSPLWCTKMISNDDDLEK